jgi:hypothetical protein
MRSTAQETERTKAHTFQRHDDHFLAALATPPLHLVQRVHQHARVDDYDVRVFLFLAIPPLQIFLAVAVVHGASLRCSGIPREDEHATAPASAPSLGVLVAAAPKGAFARCSAGVVGLLMCTLGRELRPLRTVAPVPGRRGGLLELLDLVVEERGAEGAGHCLH